MNNSTMKHILPLLTALLLMAGCSTSPHKDNDCLPEIKVNQTPDKKEITFQEIAENISYIPFHLQRRYSRDAPSGRTSFPIRW